MSILDYFRCWCCKKKDTEKYKHRITTREDVNKLFISKENLLSPNSLREKFGQYDICADCDNDEDERNRL